MVKEDVFSVVADPTRRQILELLCQQELTVSELVEKLGTTQPNVSKHLKVLRRADLMKVRVDGPRRHYALESERLQELDVWLAPFRRSWADRLDALESYLNEDVDE